MILVYGDLKIGNCDSVETVLHVCIRRGCQNIGGFEKDY